MDETDPREAERDLECVCTPDNPSGACPYHGAEVSRLRHGGKDPTVALRGEAPDA